MFQFNEESTLPTIAVPVLVLAGEHDRVTQPHASQRIADLIPRSTLAKIPGGHLQLIEFHQQVNERIGTFLEQQLATATSKPDASPAVTPADQLLPRPLVMPVQPTLPVKLRDGQSVLE